MTRPRGDWPDSFLLALAKTGNVGLSCRFAGISRQNAYRLRELDTVFSKQWDDAIQDAVALLEAVAWERALRVSDQLLMFLLRAHKPELYGDAVAGGLSRAVMGANSRRVTIREVVVELASDGTLPEEGDMVIDQTGLFLSGATPPAEEG